MLRRLQENAYFWLALIVAAGWLAWQQYAPAAADALHRAGWPGAAQPAAGLGLADYRVDIDALPIAGVTANASGLAFNRETGTLFMVINNPPAVVELSTAGRLLRSLPVSGLKDLEGIAHLEGDLFALADERGQQIFFARIGAQDSALDVSAAPRLTLAIDLAKNVGFEGLAWDRLGQRLFVVKEKSPMRVIEVAGISPVDGRLGERLDIREWLPSERVSAELRDLSSLSVHEPSGHLLLLSDESKRIAEYDAAGHLVGALDLRRGAHGLAAHVRQPEGVEFDDAGNLYVVSEPNLFYRFTPR